MIRYGFLILISVALATETNSENNDASTISNLPMDFKDDITLRPRPNFVFNFRFLRGDHNTEIVNEDHNSHSEESSTEKNRYKDLSRSRLTQLLNRLPYDNNFFGIDWYQYLTSSTSEPSLPPVDEKKFEDPEVSPFEKNKEAPLPASVDVYEHITQTQPQEQPQTTTLSIITTQSIETTPSITMPTSTLPPTPQITTSELEVTNQNMPTISVISPNQAEVMTNAEPVTRKTPTVYRGSHKFGSKQVTTIQPKPEEEVDNNLMNTIRGPIRPPPTLTPWLDGYGK